MLVLTRQKNQSIKIGYDIEVVVIGIKGKHVRLGIAAPDNVSIDRLEVRKRKDGKGT